MDQLLSLDIGQLTVTSVSRREEKLSDAAAAVTVITHEDIQRLGVTSIPEALRIVPGIQVAQINAHQWAITARGYNGALANKLLVMIDGRTVYTPVYSGTYWDDQDTLLEDVDRIEVIRGPGASLYGANAVNGVINVITKNSADTQGNYADTVIGTEEKQVEGRHGGRLAGGGTYRAYAKYIDRDDSKLIGGGDNRDDWRRLRSGFRMDKTASDKDSYTLQGDAYGGEQDGKTTVYWPVSPYSSVVDSNDNSYGGNILGRWNHIISDDSQTSLQVYLDHYSRVEQIAHQHVTTLDTDFQHNLKLSARNNFIWGAGLRVYNVDLDGGFSADLRNEEQGHDIESAFAQDEYALIPSTLFLTLGSKFERNDFTGGEVEPSARLLWKATANQTVWTSVSRAVRVPSLIEDDITADVSVRGGGTGPATLIELTGSRDLNAERLIAYEAGYRIQPATNLSFDLSAYYNDYSSLITYQRQASLMRDGFMVNPYTFTDTGAGHAYGGELSANWSVTDYWKLQGSYSYINLILDTSSGRNYLNGTSKATPHHQFSVRSYLDLPHDLKWDNALYFVDDIMPGALPIDSYLRLDTRLAWEANPGLEFSVIGRNLLDSRHQEYNAAQSAEIQRSVLGMVSWKF